jgi:hypothetical protein
MNVVTRLLSLSACAAVLSACGGDDKPPPKAPEAPVQEAPKHETSGPVVEQELGSIDQRAVEKTFNDLQGKLERCHTDGRSRVDYLSGDLKVFLRIGKDGRVKYSYFEESTLGDRETEKCILDVFAATDWPKPIGGEAEVKNGFGWPGGSERAPASWDSEKVTSAIASDKDTTKAIAKCKSGVSGKFLVTGYVEPGEPEEEAVETKGHGGKDHAKGGGKKKDAKKGAHAAKAEEPGGKFKAIGIAAPGKDAAPKADCVLDALRGLRLPSPGSYAAKVTFSL